MISPCASFRHRIVFRVDSESFFALGADVIIIFSIIFIVDSVFYNCNYKLL